MPNRSRPAARRLLAGLTWALVLLALWVWGRDITDGQGIAGPATGDIAAVGRPAGARLPPSYAPLATSRPGLVEILSVGVRAPVVPRGLDGNGGVDPPPFSKPGLVGWFAGGPAPGAAGAAVLVGHLDTRSQRAVFYRLGDVKPGEQVRVSREDGSVAEFTVEAVQVFTKSRFDPKQAYGPRKPGRAELRLITCGGDYDPQHHTYTANVVVSAYLTGARTPPPTV